MGNSKCVVAKEKHIITVRAEKKYENVTYVHMKKAFLAFASSLMETSRTSFLLLMEGCNNESSSLASMVSAYSER
jgi:hypothetical protein